MSPPLELTGEIPIPEEAGAAGQVEGGESLGEAPALPQLGRLSTGADGDTSAARAQLSGALEEVPPRSTWRPRPGRRLPWRSTAVRIPRRPRRRRPPRTIRPTRSACRPRRRWTPAPVGSRCSRGAATRPTRCPRRRRARSSPSSRTRDGDAPGGSHPGGRARGDRRGRPGAAPRHLDRDQRRARHRVERARRAARSSTPCGTSPSRW
jgi:hypothetical protein